MSYLYCYRGHTCRLELFFKMKCPKQPVLVCPIGNIRASARPMAAFSCFYETHKPPPSGNVSSIVPVHCDDHQNGQQSGWILHQCCVDCRPGGRLGDTEQVVAQWRHPVASDEALVMLHWAMRSVLHWRTALAIEMALEGGAFFCHRRLFRLL